MDRVAHAGRETAYRRVDGDATGPAVLYVHGSGGTHRVWAGQYAPDGPSHPAIALDLSGHGQSDDIGTVDGRPGESDDVMRAYVEDLAAVADATDPEILVGNSLGGAVVLQSVLEDEVHPEAIVLAGTGAKLTVLDDLRTSLAGDFDSAVEFLHGEDRLFHDAEPNVLEKSKETMKSVGQETTRRDFEVCHHFDVRGRLDEIEIPTLALCGDHDGLTPPSYHEYLAAAIPRAKYATVPDAAHLAMVEQTDAFDAAVAAFLDQL